MIKEENNLRRFGHEEMGEIIVPARITAGWR